MTAMPYKPAFGADRCDLCGRPADELACVPLELSDHVARGGRKVFRTARVIYVCNRHPGELAQGKPVIPPNARMLDGSSRKRPQAEVLFDDSAYKRGGGR